MHFCKNGIQCGQAIRMTEFDPAKHNKYSDTYIKSILDRVKTIAIVGASGNPSRPSWIVMSYLLNKGYTVIPVNPGIAGQSLKGQKVYATLADIPCPVDMVDIFRNASVAETITRDAISIGAGVVWMQLTIRNDEAAKIAESAGLDVIMNRCPKIEYGRLSGEIGWMGINSGMISSKRGKLGKGFQHRKLS